MKIQLCQIDGDPHCDRSNSSPVRLDMRSPTWLLMRLVIGYGVQVEHDKPILDAQTIEVY